MNNKIIFVLAAFLLVMFAGVYSQFAIAKTSAKTTTTMPSSSIGFKDGCADSNITHPSKQTDLHFYQHSNGNNHSKTYLQSYADGLKKCGHQTHPMP